MIATLQLADFLIAGENVRCEALTGGVSSDIWKVSTGARSYCVKRALPKRKVAADWQAPVERNAFEVAWFRIVHDIVPQAVPEILYHDEHEMLCVMSTLIPSRIACGSANCTLSVRRRKTPPKLAAGSPAYTPRRPTRRLSGALPGQWHLPRDPP